MAVAFGTGFAGARALGAARASWPYLRDYIHAFRGLLRAERVSWQGNRIQMMHPDGHAPQRPIDISILISAMGPNGLGVATELADGLFTVNGQTNYAPQFDWAALTGSADEIGRRVSEFAARGITEIIYQPTGPYITRELKAFHAAARSAVSAAAQGNTTT